MWRPLKVTVQLGGELVVDVRHGQCLAVPAPRWRLPQHMALRPPCQVRARGSVGKGPPRGPGQVAWAELEQAGGAQRSWYSAVARPRGLRQTWLAEASGHNRGGAARPLPRPHNESGSSSQPGQAGGQWREAHTAPARPPLPLLHAALPGPTACSGDSGAPASAFRRGFSRLTTAQARS